MKSFFERYGTALQLLGILIAVVAIFIGGVRLGVDVTGQRYDLRIAQMELDQAQALSKAQGEADDAKGKAATDIAAADTKHQKELSDAKATADRTIDDLRADNLRVRKRFTCPAPGGAVRADGATAGTGSGDAAEPGAGNGLSRADAEFLVRESERADAILATLKACRAVVRADRGQE